MARVRRPTSSDVAALAGVSQATVSYVLNGDKRHSIPEGTRERIRAAAETLGYTPHAAARALRRGESNVVLLVLPNVPSAANLGKFLGELTSAVSATGRALVTWTAGVGPSLRDTLTHVEARAVLVALPLPPAEEEAVRATGISVVFAAYASGSSDQNTPEQPNLLSEIAVARLQLRHLVDAGHRHVAVLSVDDPRLRTFAENRLDGFRRVCQDIGLREPDVLTLGAPDDASVATVAEAIRRWTAGPEPVTALACYNDLYAAVAMAAAREAGLDVPGDLSIIGVDNDPISRFLSPALTTVQFDFSGAATHAVALVEAALTGAPPASNWKVTEFAELIERASVAPPTVGGRGRP